MVKWTVEQFSRVVELIHEAPLAENGWELAIAGALALVQASKGAIIDVAGPGNELCGVASVGHDPAMQRLYEAYYYKVDPTLSRGIAERPLRALTVHEHFPAAIRSRHEYFEFACKADIGDVLGINTHAHAGVRSVLGFQRPFGAPEFDSQAKRLGELLAPHVELAKRVDAAVARAVGDKQVLAASLDRLTCAAFIVDRQAVIQYANVEGERWYRKDPRVRAAQRKLLLAAPGLRAALEAACQHACRAGAASTVMMLPAAGKHPAAEIVVSPLSPAHQAARHWQRPLALVVIAGLARDPAQMARRMRQLYGLTDAEARVAALLAQGQTLDQIAFARGVRLVTLRSQLKSIFGKTGVTRQAELVRLALSGAPVIPQP
jgi:DNA-binding CsgD family transcriptional regulator